MLELIKCTWSAQSAQDQAMAEDDEFNGMEYM